MDQERYRASSQRLAAARDPSTPLFASSLAHLCQCRHRNQHLKPNTGTFKLHPAEMHITPRSASAHYTPGDCSMLTRRRIGLDRLRASATGEAPGTASGLRPPLSKGASRLVASNGSPLASVSASETSREEFTDDLAADPAPNASVASDENGCMLRAPAVSSARSSDVGERSGEPVKKAPAKQQRLWRTKLLALVDIHRDARY